MVEHLRSVHPTHLFHQMYHPVLCIHSQSGSKAYSRTSFHISAEAVTWFEANDHCRREFDSPLFDPTSDPVEISMAEDYVAHIRGQVGGLEGVDQGVWTGVVDDVGQCQVKDLVELHRGD